MFIKYMKRINVEIDNFYWNELKKISIEENISIKKIVERFLYNKVDRYILENPTYTTKLKETENETDTDKQNI